MGGDDGGAAAGGALGEEVDEEGDAVAIEAVGGLVEDEEVGVAGERGEEAGAAALAERGLPRRWPRIAVTPRRSIRAGAGASRCFKAATRATRLGDAEVGGQLGDLRA